MRSFARFRQDVRLHILLGVAALALGGGAFAIDLGGVNVSKERFIVYLLTGHSNMRGYAKLMDTQTHPRAWAYVNDKWVRAKDPDFRSFGGNGSGPTMPLLKEMVARYPDYYFGVILFGQNGGNVKWNGFNGPVPAGRGFSKGMPNYNTVMGWAKAVQDKATIGGIISMFGLIEVGYGPQSSRLNFSNDVKQMVADMRADLGLPNLPFLLGKYPEGAVGGFNYNGTKALELRPEIDRIPGKVPNSALIPSNGLEMVDSIHYTQSGHRIWVDRAVDIIQDKGWFPEVSVNPPVITRQPTGATVNEGQTATFTLQATGGGLSYQWQKNGSNIAGASRLSYTTPNTKTPDDGAAFRCVVSNSAGSTTSKAAILKVVGDTTPPTITSVSASGDANTVVVVFSEPVERSSAEKTSNYAINRSVSVSAATLGSDTRTVTLTTSKLSTGITYTLTVDKVTDRSASANLIATNSALQFTHVFSPIVFAVNAAGSVYQDGSKIDYVGDTHYSGGSEWPGSTESIAGTADDALYRSERYGTSFSYAIPVSNGNYNVTVKFTELHFTSAGQRVFDVTMEGKKVISALDIYAQVGQLVAYDVSVPVSVNDGTLNIAFVAVKSHAMVSAMVIEVAGAAAGNQPPVVNAGGDTGVIAGSPVQLLGSASDDGLPTSTLTLAWSSVSGPGTVTFGSPNSAQTTATFDTAGDYALRLTANDGTLQVFDEITITVLAEPSLTIISPHGGEIWTVGATEPIRWTAVGVTDVVIRTSFDNGQTWNTLAGSVNTSSPDWENYPWAIPDTPSSQCLVRVEEYFAGGATSTSASPFEIVSGSGPDTSPPAITFTTLEVAGAVDDFSIASVSVQGVSVPANNGNFQAEIQLAPRSVTALIEASDAAGNQATRTTTVSQ